MPKIVIDAGHYGLTNRSPAVPEYYESKMSWALHLKLIAELKKYGVECGRTRSDQTKDMEVYTRGTKAKGYDMFISLHSNAIGSDGEVNDTIDRPVVIHAIEDKDAPALARKIADMLHELMGTSQPGKVSTRVLDNGKNYYGVLRGAAAVGCPHAFIIEHSFHTATKPARWLLDDANLQRVAEKEAEIIAGFFGLDKKEEEEMTKDEIQKLVDEAVKRARAEDATEIAKLEKRISELEEYNHVYHWYDQLPDYARPIIEKMHKEGVFSGAGKHDMALTEDMMRILVILVNNGVLK